MDDRQRIVRFLSLWLWRVLDTRVGFLCEGVVARFFCFDSFATHRICESILAVRLS
ncbi:MAG: hypothetical protein ACTTJS_07455 [Wolinella sp.]